MNKRMGTCLALFVIILTTCGCGREPLKYETIWESAENGAISDISKHLSKGVALNARSDENGETPLMVAAGAGQLEMVKYLIKRGADLNITDEWQQTAAFKALGNGHRDVLRTLLANGADVNFNDGDGRTLLSIAAENDDTELVKLLTSLGASATGFADGGPDEEPGPDEELATGFDYEPEVEYSEETAEVMREALKRQDPETYARMEEKEKQADCVSNVKQIGLALMMYVQDYDERTPRPKDVSTVLYPYMKNEQLWLCPSWATGKPGYAISRSVTSRSLGTFRSPAETFSFFESGLGKEPLVGGPADLADPARHNGGNNFGYMDGHARWISVGSEPATAWTIEAGR